MSFFFKSWSACHMKSFENPPQKILPLSNPKALSIATFVSFLISFHLFLFYFCFDQSINPGSRMDGIGRGMPAWSRQIRMKLQLQIDIQIHMKIQIHMNTNTYEYKYIWNYKYKHLNQSRSAHGWHWQGNCRCYGRMLAHCLLDLGKYHLSFKIHVEIQI